ncbi:hypothetical protein [Streptomyces albogriseolus]|uniref:hypothetical protein n=1 Tax=Streptomyces albogriseolus TaxID=1887 RepID=UPI003460E67C
MSLTRRLSQRGWSWGRLWWVMALFAYNAVVFVICPTRWLDENGYGWRQWLFQLLIVLTTIAFVLSLLSLIPER